MSLWPPKQARKCLQQLLGHVDILFGSPEELALLTGSSAADRQQLAEVLAASGVSQLVIKDGPRGAELFTGGAWWRASARPVTIVDPIGAGDGFAAGYLSAVLDHSDPAQRLARGVHTASYVLESQGDWEGLPTRSELEADAPDQPGPAALAVGAYQPEVHIRR